MVKLDPARIHPTTERVSCIDCDSDQVKRDVSGSYDCGRCGASRPRALIITPAIRWWTAPDGEYWHDTAGVFVHDAAGNYLLFRRTRFPFGLTIPAGHVDAGEPAEVAGRRELLEETSIRARVLHRLGEVDIMGDSCRRGADAHHWHCFVTAPDDTGDVLINDEGVSPVWLSVAEMRDSTELTYATSFLVGLYEATLSSGHVSAS